MRDIHLGVIGMATALLVQACSGGPSATGSGSAPTASSSSTAGPGGPAPSATSSSLSPSLRPASTGPTTAPRPSVAAAAAQACLRTVLVGYSVRHRAILACERGAPAGVALVAIGVIHGNEQLGLSVLSRLRRMPVPRGVDLWTITAVNPDGLAAGTRQNAHRVDLNRNWPPTWQPSSSSSATYGGPSAASEPETRALAAFLGGLRPRTVLVFHSPLDAVDFSEGADPAVTRFMAKASGYPARTLGARPGSFTGWFNVQPWNGTAITFEFGTSASTTQLDRVSRAVMSLAAWRAG
jgi:succinylglutamate desuccinylase